MRKLLPCTFPQPAANSVHLKRQRCIDTRQEWLAVGPMNSIHILMKWAWINLHEVLLHLTNYRNLCLTRRVLWVICSCTSNAFEETQNASTGILDSITPIFLGYWHALIFWRDTRLLAIETIEILFLFAAYFGLFSCTSNAFEKTQNAGARWESQVGCIFSQLQTSVARQ